MSNEIFRIIITATLIALNVIEAVRVLLDIETFGEC
jgi:hypothetical protein